MIWWLACSPAPTPPLSHPDARIVRVQIQTPQEALAVEAVVLDVMDHHVDDHLDVLVDRPGLQQIRDLGLPHETLVYDLSAAARAAAASFVEDDGDFFADWRDLEAFEDHLAVLAADHPQATQIELGTSVEGRPILGMRITDPSAPDDRLGILVTATQHAREWGAASSAMVLIERLLDLSDPDAIAVLAQWNVVVVPIANPDGYRHTWTVDRLWRKNRRPNPDGTFGIDLNRNWDASWGAPGASDWPADGNYRGPAPFSEPETTALAAAFTTDRRYARHLDLHCFGQAVIRPWGATAEPSVDEGILAAGGDAMAQAMQAVWGTDYDSGTFYNRLYPGSGVAIDWTHQQGLHSYLYELRDRGASGFFLPIDQLVPTAEEAWAGFVALAEVADPPRLWIEGDPPNAGGDLTVEIWRASASDVVGLWISTTGPGITTTSDGVILHLDGASPVVDAIADTSGHATAVIPVPGDLVAGDVLWVQAATDDVASVLLTITVQ